jgi:hypothetical protein
MSRQREIGSIGMKVIMTSLALCRAHHVFGMGAGHAHVTRGTRYVGRVGRIVVALGDRIEVPGDQRVKVYREIIRCDWVRLLCTVIQPRFVTSGCIAILRFHAAGCRQRKPKNQQETK